MKKIVLALIVCLFVSVPAIAGEDLFSIPMAESTFLQMRTDTNADGNVEYLGYAMPGKAITETGWCIAYFQYNSDGWITKTFARKTGEARPTNNFAFIWLNRTSYNYGYAGE